MSFEYGSEQIHVRNPFSFQGKLMLASGVIFLLLGIVLFFIISARSNEIVSGGGTDRMVLFFRFFGTVVLTGAGVSMIIKGLFMVNKFYVGRGMPADLAYDITKDPAEYAGNPNSLSFDADELNKALFNRMNPSFIEPSGLLARLIHTYNPRLLYLPLQLRNITQAAFECAAYMTGILLLFALSMLSGFIGVNEFTSTPIWKYIGWVYVIMMLFTCYSKIPRNNLVLLKRTSEKELVMLIIFSLLIPVIAGLTNGAREVSSSPIPLLAAFTVLSIAVFIYIYFLALKRIPESLPKTEVSEFREQWDESVNPQEIFRNVDMTLADHRYMEIPNRKYRDADSGLILYDKGEYSGSMIQETQPIPYEEINNNSLTRSYKKICAYVAQVLITVSGILLFYIVAFSNPGTTTTLQTFSSLIWVFIFYYFGFILYKTAYNHFGEIRFKSHLIHFFADGTFNKSKISTGMSVYDSLRSENELVRTSIRPWIVCAEIETTTFATSGHYNLEQYRTILELKKDDSWLNNIVATLKTYLRERRVIADTVSKGDLQTTIRTAQINQIISSNYNHGEEEPKQLDIKITELMNDEVKKNYE